MDSFKRIWIGLIFICIVISASTSISYAAPPSDRCILIKVQVTDRDDVNKLASLGLDIWEYRDGGMIIRVTNEEREQVKESDFTIETITEDVYEYTKKIRQQELSLFAETTARYHTYDEVIGELQALEASGVAKTYIIGNSWEGRDILAVRISDNPTEDEDEPGALFFGCQHAREWIAIEVPLYIAQYLVDNYDTDAYIKRLVDNCEIWVVPLVNPDGYEYSRTVDQMWRKNRHGPGVDLNRNWGYMWGLDSGSSSITSSIVYRGTAPFSEPETQAMRDLILAYDFQIMVDYHSYGLQTLMPWLYTQLLCPDYFPMHNITYKMRELIKQTSGSVYTDWWDSSGYVCSGDSKDWGYGELGIYAFGVELGAFLFAPAENHINIICEENLPAALYLISLAAPDGGIENSRTGKTYSSIQFAINDALDGDEIVISEGTYQENILLRGHYITLRSTNPNDPAVVGATVIDGENDQAIMMYEGHDTGCELNGLTITGRTVVISTCDAAPTIRNCTIETTGRTAIDFWEGSEPITIDCNIRGGITTAVNPEIDDIEPRKHGLIAHWALDESDGTTAYDSASEYGEYDGTLNGDPIWRPESGIVDGALEFDGVDDYIRTPSFVLNTLSNEFSIFAWVMGGEPEQVIISQIGRRDWLYADPENGCLMTELSHHAIDDQSLLSEAVITDGEWHRVGHVWDLTYRTLYVDDVEVASDEQESVGALYGGLYIGTGKSRTSNSYWSGLIDDVRIYNRAIKP